MGTRPRRPRRAARGQECRERAADPRRSRGLIRRHVRPCPSSRGRSRPAPAPCSRSASAPSATSRRSTACRWTASRSRRVVARGRAPLPHRGHPGGRRPAARARLAGRLHRGHDRRGAAAPAATPWSRSSSSASRTADAELRPEAASRSPARNVHRAAATAAQGDLLLEPGTRLDAPEIAVAASAGMPRVAVSRRSRASPWSPPATSWSSRANRSSALAGAPLERLRPRRGARRSRLPARRRTTTCPTMRTCCCERLARAPRRARRADALRRRLDGPLRSRARGARGARRAARCSTRSRSGRASRCGSAWRPPAQAVFAPAGQSGVDAGLPGALCDPGARPRDGARRERRRETDRPRRADSRSSRRSRYFLPVQLEYDEWAGRWPSRGRPTAPATSSSLAGTDGSWNCHRARRTYPTGFVAPLYRW